MHPGKPLSFTFHPDTLSPRRRGFNPFADLTRSPFLSWGMDEDREKERFFLRGIRLVLSLESFEKKLNESRVDECFECKRKFSRVGYFLCFFFRVSRAFRRLFRKKNGAQSGDEIQFYEFPRVNEYTRLL